MKKPIIVSVILIVLIAAIVYLFSGSKDLGKVEFNFEVSTATVSDAKICTSLTGNLCAQDNTVIPTSASEIYVSCKLKYAPENTKVKFSWMYYGDTKFEIDNIVLDTGNNTSNLELHSYLSRPDNGWPKGVYEVTIQVQTDNAKPLVKQFNVE